MFFTFSEQDGITVATFNDGARQATATTNSATMAELLRSTAGAHDRASKRLQPAALADQVREDAVPTVRQLGAEIRAAGKAATDLSERYAVALTPPPSIPTIRFAERRASWRGQSDAEQVQRAQTADAEALAALLDGGRDLSGITNDHAWEIIQDRALPVFHVARSGMQARYALQPTADRLVVSGPDVAAAERAATEAADRLRADRDALDETEAHLQSVLTLLAVLTGRTREAVLAEALAA